MLYTTCFELRWDVARHGTWIFKYFFLSGSLMELHMTKYAESLLNPENDGELDWHMGDMIRLASCDQLTREIKQLVLYVRLRILFPFWGQEFQILFFHDVHIKYCFLQSQWQHFCALIKTFWLQNIGADSIFSMEFARNLWMCECLAVVKEYEKYSSLNIFMWRAVSGWAWLFEQFYFVSVTEAARTRATRSE